MVVMVVAVIPPILHFFTGPVSPAIGGFIAGRQFSLSDREAALMGVLLALAAGIPAYIVMDGLIANEPFAITAAIIAALWSGGLATVAAWFAAGSDGAEPEEAS